MVKRCACVLLLILGAWTFSTKAQVERGNIDWIFVLDTSASMRGAGGTANIFQKVKDAISEFIRSARNGDTVTLYTFDRDTSLRSHIRISGEIDKKDLLKAVADLQSEGDRTHTGKAIREALERTLDLRNRPDAASRTISIVLFTDGLEDIRGIPDPISIPSNTALIPKDQPYIFFVSLGVQAHETQVESFVKNPAMGNRGEVIRDPGAGSIGQVGDTIRKKVDNPPEPKTVNVEVKPVTLSFGEIEPGETASQTIEVRSNSDCDLRIALSPDNEGLILSGPDEVVSLQAEQITLVEVQLTTAASLADGPRNFSLVVGAEPKDSNGTSTTVSVAGTLTVSSTPVWLSILKYLLLLVFLFAIALVIVSVIKGEPPWVWIPNIVAGPSLEGELQVLQPRLARVEHEFISLTQLRTRKVSLSSLVPTGFTGDSDAELEAIKQNGKLTIKLHRIKGTVFINNIEVASTEMHNDDVIGLEGTKLLFSWVNQDHPLDSEELEAT